MGRGRCDFIEPERLLYVQAVLGLERSENIPIGWCSLLIPAKTTQPVGTVTADGIGRLLEKLHIVFVEIRWRLEFLASYWL